MNPKVNFALIIVILIFLIYIYSYLKEVDKLREYAHSINLMSYNLKTNEDAGKKEEKQAIDDYKKSYKILDNWYNSKSAEDIKNVKSFKTLEEKSKNYGSYIETGMAAGKANQNN